MTTPEIKYFISYAHDDNAFFRVFRKGITAHLSNSGSCNFISWDDAEIPTGAPWHEEIQKNLKEAKVAILCVSSNFLNSEYIRANEFAVLTDKFPGKVIIPVYFSSCDFSGWKDLAQIQFFKPGGQAYEKGGTNDFAFCDLVKFNHEEGLLVPNSNIDKYFTDLVKRIEKTLGVNDKAAEISPFEIPLPPVTPPPVKPGSEKIVSTIIISVMAVSAGFVLFFLLFQKMNTEGMFKSSLGCVMFFCSGALFFKNKKSIAV